MKRKTKKGHGQPRDKFGRFLGGKRPAPDAIARAAHRLARMLTGETVETIMPETIYTEGKKCSS